MKMGVNKFLEGKKTYIGLILAVATGLATFAGVPVDANTIQLVQTLAGVIAGYGIYDKQKRIAVGKQ